MEVLKQGKSSSLSAADQVVILYAVTNNLLRDIPVSRIAEFETALLTEVNEAHGDLISEITQTGKLSKETESALKTVITEFAAHFA